jgi:hypothetical protein
MGQSSNMGFDLERILNIADDVQVIEDGELDLISILISALAGFFPAQAAVFGDEHEIANVAPAPFGPRFHRITIFVSERPDCDDFGNASIVELGVFGHVRVNDAALALGSGSADLD